MNLGFLQGVTVVDCILGEMYRFTHLEVFFKINHCKRKCAAHVFFWSLAGTLTGVSNRSGSSERTRPSASYVFKPCALPTRRLVKAAYLSHHAIVVIVVVGVIVMGIDII